MQVSVESTGTLGRKITVQVPSEQIDDAVEKKLKDLSRSVKLDGFRPGKVPLKVVKQKFSGQVRQEVMGEVLQSTLYEAINQEKLKPAEGPKVENVNMEPGQAMEYSATFEVYPEVELVSLQGKKIEKIVSNVEDSDVDKMFEKLQTQRVTWENVERAAEESDQIIINFVGRINGEEFEGGKAENVPLVLGSNSMIPGFEEQLTGVKEGDNKTIEVTFPEDYQSKEVAGKQAEFDIQVLKVNQPVLPQLDDEFAKAFGISGGIDEFRGEVRNNMERELATRLQSLMKNAVMDALLEANQLELPQALVDDEIKNLMQQAMGHRPEALKDVNLPKELFTEQASKRVSLGLLVGEVIQANNLQVDKDQVKKKLDEIAGTYEQPDEVIKAYSQNQKLLQSLEGLVLEDQVVELLGKQLEIEEKTVPFDDIMNENPSE
jgi:trigger factor